MSYLEAIILGVIQGLTEFLPVSSSGHIELGKAILGTEEAGLSFSVVVHCATVLSTIVVFRNDIADILGGLFQFKWNRQTIFSAKIIVSMVPAVLAGLLLKDKIEPLFEGNLTLVGGCLLLTALLLMLTHFAPNGRKKVTFGSALLTGISQALAILPGVSRSGSTISTMLYLGIDKAKAARFSFLMVIPVILGAMIMDFKDIMSGEVVAAGEAAIAPTVLLAGFVAAFLAGLAACSWMLDIVKKGKLYYFALYCAIVGTVALIVG